MTTSSSNSTKRTVAIAVALLAAAGGGFWIARHVPATAALEARNGSQVEREPKGAEAKEMAEAGRPKEENEEKESAKADELKIPSEYLISADIGVEAAVSRDVRAELLLPAAVTAAPGAEAVVISRAQGTLVRVTHRLGDTVRAGEVLATVESPDAATMASDRSVAQARAELARKTYERELSLYQEGVTPRQAMETARADVDVAQAEAQRARAVAQAAHLGADGRTVTIASPIAGRITASTAVLGAHVSPDAEVFRVAMPGAVQVEAPVTADDLRRVAVGDRATILTRNGPPVAATVRGLTPNVSAASRAATAVLVPDPGQDARTLLAGDGVQVRLHAGTGSSREGSKAGSKAGSGNGEGPNGVAVPEDAVQNLDGRDVVYLRTPDGFRAQPVLVGPRSGGMAQIISGLEAGQKIATRNAFLLKAEARKSTGDDE